MFLAFFRSHILVRFFALLLSAYPLAAVAAPATGVARPTPLRVSLDYFKQRLTPLGQWIMHPAWGEAWKPAAGPDFRPYFYGYWEYTSDHGWLWVSSEPYGDIVYHYGRWLLDPRYGWIWLPGYIWGPSWVVWREAGDYIGWFAMPPGYQDFSTGPLASPSATNDSYGYRNLFGGNFAPDAFAHSWVFVLNRDFGRSDRRPYVIDPVRLRGLYQISLDRTRYIYDRIYDRVVDQSFDRERLEALTHRQFDHFPAAHFLHRRVPVTTVMQGRDIFRQYTDQNRNGLLSEPGASAQIGARLDTLEQPGLSIGRGLSGRANRLTGALDNFLDANGRGLGTRPTAGMEIGRSERTRPEVGTPSPNPSPGTVGIGNQPDPMPGTGRLSGSTRNGPRGGAFGGRGGILDQSDPLSSSNAPARAALPSIGGPGFRARRIYPYADNTLAPSSRAPSGVFPDPGLGIAPASAVPSAGAAMPYGPRTRIAPASRDLSSAPTSPAAPLAAEPVTQGRSSYPLLNRPGGVPNFGIGP